MKIPMKVPTISLSSYIDESSKTIATLSIVDENSNASSNQYFFSSIDESSNGYPNQMNRSNGRYSKWKILQMKMKIPTTNIYSSSSMDESSK